MQTRFFFASMLAVVATVAVGCNPSSLPEGAFEYYISAYGVTSAPDNGTNAAVNAVQGTVEVAADGTISGTGNMTYSYLAPCAWEPPVPTEQLTDAAFTESDSSSFTDDSDFREDATDTGECDASELETCDAGEPTDAPEYTAPASQQYCSLTGVTDAPVQFTGTVKEYVTKGDGGELTDAVFASLEQQGVKNADRAPSVLELTIVPAGVPQEHMDFWGFSDGSIQARSTGIAALGFQAAGVFDTIEISPIVADSSEFSTEQNQVMVQYGQKFLQGSDTAANVHSTVGVVFESSPDYFATQTNAGVWGQYTANYPADAPEREFSEAEQAAIDEYTQTGVSPSDSQYDWYDEFPAEYWNDPEDVAAMEEIRQRIVDNWYYR